MDIIGYRVIHKSIKNNFGIGVICELTDMIVSVSFADKAGTQKIVKFTFPNAFKTGHLIAADTESEQAIREAIRALKCSRCGLENKRTEKIGGKWYCEQCKARFTFVCSSCGDSHETSAMVRAWDGGRYKHKVFCKTCGNLKSFVCKHCNSRYDNEFRSPFACEGKDLCRDCFDDVARVCKFCNRAFDVGEGDYFNKDDETVYVCPECLDANTFVCKECGERRLNSSLVNSKYVPPDKLICNECAWNCAVCGVAIDDEDRHTAFNRSFCPGCWESHKKKCPRCGDVFVPDETNDQYCPDCVDMNQYVARLQKENFLSRTYKSMNYFSLENIDRCKLFTDLYDYCQLFAGRHVYMRETDSPFQMLVLDLIPYRIVITYLQPEIKGSAKNTLNITMTEFRKKVGRGSVRKAILRWLEGGKNRIETAAGTVTVLDYPIRLRVQTNHDKHYGKE